MTTRHQDDRLPVPAEWQGAVTRALADLIARTGAPPAAVTVARVEEAEWRSRSPGTDTSPHRVDKGLDIWLLAEGRTFRYLVALPDGVPIAGTDPEP